MGTEHEYKGWSGLSAKAGWLLMGATCVCALVVMSWEFSSTSTPLPTSTSAPIATAEPETLPPGFDVEMSDALTSELGSTTSEFLAKVTPAVGLLMAYEGDDPVQLGSVFVVDHGDGESHRGAWRHAFTSAHLAHEDWKLEVVMNGELYEKVQVVSRDDILDVAVLRLCCWLSTPGLRVSQVPVGEGDFAVAVGFPIVDRVEMILTAGQVVKRDFIEGRDFIIHTAPLAQGSSGGPLLTRSGKVMGMNTAELWSGDFGAVPYRVLAQLMPVE